VQGIRDASAAATPKIIIHIDRGGDWTTTQWFFDNLRQQQVAFDIIGQSYYPFWHGPLSSLANCLTNAAGRYQKPVLIAETAFPWTNSIWGSNIAQIVASPDGQVQFVAALASALNQVPLLLRAGLVWWGAEYQSTPGVNEAGFNKASFFNADGNMLPVVDALAQTTRPVALSARVNDSLLLLNWPLSAAGFSLKTTTNLVLSAPWVSVTNANQIDSAGFHLSLPLPSQPCSFYQLRWN
jgi:arabinogalactan endo-1,4-beta-galactosidase